MKGYKSHYCGQVTGYPYQFPSFEDCGSNMLNWAIKCFNVYMK